MKKLKSEHHSGDVSIGKDEWIRFVDITDRITDAANLDSQIRPTEGFWRALEVNCVSECCGINAHSFWPADIWNAARSCRDPELPAKLLSLRKHVHSLSASCVHSDILNQSFDRTMFQEILDHVIATIAQMRPQSARGAGSP